MGTEEIQIVLMVVSICLAIGAGVAGLIALYLATRAHRALEALRIVYDLELKHVREGQQRQSYFIDAIRSMKGIGGNELEARANFFSDCGRLSWQPNPVSLFSAAAEIKTEDDRSAKTDFLRRCRSLLPEAQGDALLVAAIAVRTQAEVDAAIAVLQKRVVEEWTYHTTQTVHRQMAGGSSSDAARDYDEVEETVETTEPRDVSAALALIGNPRELRDKIIAWTEAQQGKTT